MWPGVFSLSAQYIRNGGTALFAYLALAGDLGCSIGPAVVGSIVEWTGQQLQVGILGAIVFPIILLAGIYLVQQMHKNDSFRCWFSRIHKKNKNFEANAVLSWYLLFVSEISSQDSFYPLYFDLFI